MAKVIISSAVPDLFPSPVYVAKITAGAAEGDVLITSIASYTLIDLPAGLWVHDVAWEVTTAFNANVDLTLGTSTDPDGFAITDNMGATTVDVLPAKMSGQHAGTDVTLPGAFYSGGFRVPSTGDVLSATIATTAASAGVVDVYVFYTYAGAIPVDMAESRMRTHQFQAGHGN